MGERMIAPRALAVIRSQGEPMTAREIGEALDVRQDAVVRALRDLLREGIIQCEIVRIKGGRPPRTYRLAPPPPRQNGCAVPGRRPPRAPRTCLCCGNVFRSAGPHNRLCDHCKKISVSPYAP